MKIIDKEVCYLQGYEAVFIASKQNAPGTLLEEIFQYTGSHPISVVGDGYRFDCLITCPESVAWLGEHREFVDYFEYSHLPISVLKRTVDIIKHDLCEELKEYNQMDRDYRDEHYYTMGRHIDEVRHQVSSLELLMKYKNREVEFVFPEVLSKEPDPKNFWQRLKARISGH